MNILNTDLLRSFHNYVGQRCRVDGVMVLNHVGNGDLAMLAWPNQQEESGQGFVEAYIGNR